MITHSFTVELCLEGFSALLCRLPVFSRQFNRNSVSSLLNDASLLSPNTRHYCVFLAKPNTTSREEN